MKYKQLDNLFHRLWPICRSITGPGISESLEILREYVPFEIKEIPTGKQVFDWIVPQEWELDRATLKTTDGELIIDTLESNLHVLNFSEPFFGIVNFDELNQHLYSIPDIPEAVPYVTSYYKSRWGLCITENKRKTLRKDINYIVDIKTKKYDGHLRYGDCLLEGDTDDTFLITSYLCHPSLANNELSGPLALASIYNKLKNEKKRKFTYRFVICPETIGSISFLASTPDTELAKIVSGLVLTCLGGPSRKISFKHSRRHWLDEITPIDNLVEKFSNIEGDSFEAREFSPTGGSDERQFCSPSVNLPIIQAARTVYGEYSEYHTSLDKKEFMQLSSIIDSVQKLTLFLKSYELEHFRLTPTIRGGEPMLGKRDLYPSINSPTNRHYSNDEELDSRHRLNLILNVISLIDGKHLLTDISDRLRIPYRDLVPVIEELIEKGVCTLE